MNEIVEVTTPKKAVWSMFCTQETCFKLRNSKTGELSLGSFLTKDAAEKALNRVLSKSKDRNKEK